MHFICCKLTAIGWSHSLIITCNEITAKKQKQRSCSQLGSRTNTSPRRPVLFCMCRSSPAIKWRKNDFVIKSITRSWLKRCSFHCLWRRETISPRVILWAGIANKQAASGSNYCCMKLSVLEGNKISHGLIISHDTDEQDFTPTKQHKFSRTGLSVQLWIIYFYLDAWCFFNGVFGSNLVVKAATGQTKSLQIFLFGVVFFLLLFSLRTIAPLPHAFKTSVVYYHDQQTVRTRLAFLFKALLHNTKRL